MIGRELFMEEQKKKFHDILEPKGKHVTTPTYVDANLHHDQVTGKAVTVCLHIVNATPSQDKLQLRLQLMDLNLWQQELPQTKSLISGTH